MRNLLTDVAGVRVGHADDARLASGLTAVVFDAPATASIAIHGGAPGVRDTALLEPEMTVEAVDALVLSGGSAFGLDGMGGAMAALAEKGRGFAVGADPRADRARRGSVRPRQWWRQGLGPAAALLGLRLRGGRGGGSRLRARQRRGWVRRHHGRPQGRARLVQRATRRAAMRSGRSRPSMRWARRRSATARISGPPPTSGTANSAASAFRSSIAPARRPSAPRARRRRTPPSASSSTDAVLTKAQCKRLAVVAQGGLALALRPAHAALDGDVVFAAATGMNPRPVDHPRPDRDRRISRPRRWRAPSRGVCTRRPPCPSRARSRVGGASSAGP